MLTGQELGKAIRSALEQNGKTPADAARHFKVKPPSISGWMGTGRISKGNFNELITWLNKTPLSHWGLKAPAADPLDGNTVPQVNERRAVYRVVSIESAVESIASHLEALEGYDKPTAISLLTTLANSPDMHAIVAAGLRTLKPLVRGDPSKQSALANKASDARAA